MTAATARKKLEAVAPPKQLRSVEIALREETQVRWDFADAVYEDVLEVAPHGVATPSDQAHTGLFAAEEQVYKAHRDAGTEVTKSAIHNMFVTRRVWPPDQRLPHLASFSVHYELRGKDFRNRRALIEKHAAKSKNGRWSLQDMRRWKSEHKPAPMKSFLQLLDERVRRVLYQSGKPWHTVTDDDRESIVALLRAIQGEVADGTFGTK